MTSRTTRVASVCGTALLTLALTGAFAPAAFATDEATAPTSGPDFTTQAQELLSEDNVEAVATDGQGNVIVYTTEPVEELDAAPQNFIEDNANVIVKVVDAPFDSLATTDVVGGAGYVSFDPDDADGGGALCSVGFSGWDPSGNPAVISAGHCTDDGAAYVSGLTLPSGDTAGGGDPDGGDVVGTELLGELAFAQYGGPGNTPGTNGSTSSVDIAVIDVLNDDLTLLPEVTDWTTAASEDLSASTTRITDVGSAQLGAVAKSGRTTGHTTGTVDAIEGWANVSGRMVYGFSALLLSDQGDSGGSLYQGSTAVGVLSGGTTVGGQPITWGANLEAGLALTGGYTVALHVDAPALTTPADGGEVEVGAAISGTGPAGHTLVVTPSGQDPFEVAIDGSGNWSFPAPNALGDYAFALVAQKGFNESAPVSYTVEIVPAPVHPPVFTNPVDGQQLVTEATAISGTGEPGATVTLSGDVAGTAVVAGNGTWTIPVDLGIGAYDVSAIQTRDDIDSDPATAAFSVVPAAPVVTDPQDERIFAYDSAPTAVSGTGVDGATITVTLDGEFVGEATVENGTWTVPFAQAPAAGDHVLVVTQTIDGQSNSTETTFTVEAAPGATPAGETGPGLVEAGFGDALPFTAGAVLLLLAGGALIAIRRSRSGAATER